MENIINVKIDLMHESLMQVNVDFYYILKRCQFPRDFNYEILRSNEILYVIYLSFLSIVLCM